MVFKRAWVGVSWSMVATVPSKRSFFRLHNRASQDSRAAIDSFGFCTTSRYMLCRKALINTTMWQILIFPLRQYCPLRRELRKRLTAVDKYSALLFATLLHNTVINSYVFLIVLYAKCPCGSAEWFLLYEWSCTVGYSNGLPSYDPASSVWGRPGWLLSDCASVFVFGMIWGFGKLTDKP